MYQPLSLLEDVCIETCTSMLEWVNSCSQFSPADFFLQALRQDKVPFTVQGKKCQWILELGGLRNGE